MANALEILAIDLAREKQRGDAVTDALRERGRRLSALTAELAELRREYDRLERINGELRRRVADAVTVLNG